MSTEKENTFEILWREKYTLFNDYSINRLGKHRYYCQMLLIKIAMEHKRPLRYLAVNNIPIILN